MRLNATNVIYDRNEHTYTLNGVLLSGVTAMIKYQLQPDSYKGIPKEILDRAAAKGSLIHDMCEDYDNYGDSHNDYHVEDYARLCKEKGLVYEMSEYVVSDGKYFASPIDKVYRVDDNTVDIGDIKTISKFGDEDREKVTWQTSIYAHGLEQMNPGIKVRNLYVIWLPDLKYQSSTKKPMIEVLKRVSDDEVQRLLDCEVNDEKYRENSVPRSQRGNVGSEVVKADPLVPAQVAMLHKYVIEVLENYAEAESLKKEMLAQVQEAMANNNIKSWATDKFTFSSVAASTRRTLDLAKLKEKYPEIDLEDESLYKVSNVKASFKVSIK